MFFLILPITDPSIMFVTADTHEELETLHHFGQRLVDVSNYLCSIHSKGLLRSPQCLSSPLRGQFWTCFHPTVLTVYQEQIYITLPDSW